MLLFRILAAGGIFLGQGLWQRWVESLFGASFQSIGSVYFCIDGGKIKGDPQRVQVARWFIRYQSMVLR